METANLALAILSLAGAVIVARAYLPHIPFVEAQGPPTYLARAFVLSAAAYFPRTAYWDIYWPLTGGDLTTPVVNVVVNATIIAAEWCAMRARYEAIPLGVRGNYWTWTAYRYPPGTRMFRLR